MACLPGVEDDETQGETSREDEKCGDEILLDAVANLEGLKPKGDEDTCDDHKTPKDSGVRAGEEKERCFLGNLAG